VADGDAQHAQLSSPHEGAKPAIPLRLRSAPLRDAPRPSRVRYARPAAQKTRADEGVTALDGDADEQQGRGGDHEHSHRGHRHDASDAHLPRTEGHVRRNGPSGGRLGRGGPVLHDEQACSTVTGSSKSSKLFPPPCPPPFPCRPVKGTSAGRCTAR